MNKIFTLLTLLLSVIVNAQDGSIDSSFGLINSFPGYTFKTITSYGEINNGWGNSVSITQSGQLIIGGTVEKRSSFSSPLVYNFGFHTLNTGSNTISDDNLSGSGYLENCNGSIVLSNSKSMIIGQVDYQQNNISYQGGIHITRKAILMQRFNSTGNPDTSINSFGKITIDIGYAEEFQAIKEWNNKLYACGYSQTLENQSKKLLIAKLNLDGTLDTSFNSNGYKTIDFSGFENSFDLVIQSDGKILVISKSTNTQNKFVIHRLNTDATLDNTFGVNGVSEIIINNFGTAFPKKIQLQNDGKIVVAGTFYENNNTYKYAIIKLNQNGTIDTSFANNGRYISLIGNASGGKLTSLKLLENNKILTAGNLSGNSGIGLVRLNSNGTLDNTFGSNGISTITNNNVTNVNVGDFIIKPDNKIIIVGTAKANAPNNKLQIFVSQINNSNSVLSTIETTNNTKISIYPNPAKETIYLSNIEETEYEIYDIIGKSIIKGKIIENHINVNSLPKGIYVLKLKTRGNIINKKFIKE